MRLTDLLSSHPATLATERLRAESESDAARGDRDAAASRLPEAAEGADAPYWALSLRGFALFQQGRLGVSLGSILLTSPCGLNSVRRCSSVADTLCHACDGIWMVSWRPCPGVKSDWKAQAKTAS